MDMKGIAHPYISVSGHGRLTYGGSQRDARDPAMQKWGCGVIAATDLLLYLQRTRPGCRLPVIAPRTGAVPFDLYRQAAARLRRGFFPLIPGFGLNAFVLAFGLNRLFRRGRIPLRAAWGCRRREMWDRIGSMLDQDLPVILCVGRGWPGRRLSFYIRNGENGLVRASRVSGHYVTITGMSERWLRISSWGRELYIDRRELETYIRSASGSFLTNIVSLRPVDRKS